MPRGSGKDPEVGGWETGFGDKGGIEDSGSLEVSDRAEGLVP